jgi:hypothetical protein
MKYPLFLLDFNKTWKFLDKFSKNPQISNFVKIRPVWDKLLHPEERQMSITAWKS